MKCGQTDPSTAERPSVACHRLGRDRPCLVKVGVFGTCRALFGISQKLPEYLPRTLVRVHAHQHKDPEKAPKNRVWARMRYLRVKNAFILIDALGSRCGSVSIEAGTADETGRAIRSQMGPHRHQRTGEFKDMATKVNQYLINISQKLATCCSLTVHELLNIAFFRVRLANMYYRSFDLVIRPSMEITPRSYPPRPPIRTSHSLTTGCIIGTASRSK